MISRILQYFRAASIRQKQMHIIMGVCMLALVLAGVVSLSHGVLSRRRETGEFLLTRCNVLGRTCYGALDFQDAKAAGENLNALKADSEMVAATVFTADGKLFARYTRADVSDFKQSLSSTNAVIVFERGRAWAVRPILREKELLGYFLLESDLTALEKATKYQAGITGLALALAIALAYFLSFRLQRIISGPILGLLETTRAVAIHQDYSLRARKESADELGQLVDGFNHMLEQVESRDAELKLAQIYLEKRVEERTEELEREVEERRRTEKAVQESQKFLQSTLDALSAHIAILDESGVILSVNAAWYRFARDNQKETADPGPGWNYLEVCDRSHGDCGEEASSVARGIRAVMAGETAEFLHEYPCHSPNEQRWFIVRVTCFGDEGARRVVVAHENITGRKLSEEKLNESLRSLAAFNAVLDRACTIATTDVRGTITHANDNFCHSSEYSREELLGQNHRLVNSGHHPAAFFTELWRTIASGSVWRGEVKNRAKSGRTYWEDATIGPLLDEQGKPKGYLAIRTNITERKKADEERARLVDFLEASLNEVYVFDAESLRFSYVNRSARENLGYTAEQIAKLTPLDIKREFTEETFRRALAPLLAGTVPKHLFQTIHRRANGTDYPVEVCLQLVATGTERVFLAVINDITERKKAEAELTKAQQELLDVSRRAGMAEMATGVLHNVGNVLNSVNVASTCIADGIRKSKSSSLAKVVALLRANENDLGGFFANDPKGKQLPGYLARLADQLALEQAATQKELAGLQQHIDHIKEIVASQQSLAKVSGLTEILNVTDVVEEALRLNQNSLAAHRLQIIREFAAVPEITVEKHKVLQILVNLVQNAKQACKATDRDDRQMTLRILNDQDRVRISVSDNGVGIPVENLTRIFNHGFTTKKTGHGFGLHNAANAAKAMGGDLYVHSAGVGHGATFTLELPIQPSKKHS